MSKRIATVLSLPLIYVLLSPVVPISMRYLTSPLDNLTQNAVRMGSGAIALLLVALVGFRSELVALLRAPRTVALLAAYSVSAVVGMFAAVEGLARTPAAMYGLVAVLGVPVTVALAALLFGDERAVVRDRRFILGMAVAVVGTVGVTLTAPGAQLVHSIGVLWLLLAMIVGVLGNVLLKHVVTSVHPMAMAAVTSVIYSVLFCILAAAAGQLHQLVTARPVVIVVAVLSGVYGLLCGVALHLILLKRIGLARLNVLCLSTPVLTAVVAYVLIGDRYSVGQMLCGLVVLAGCWAAGRPGGRGRPQAGG